MKNNKIKTIMAATLIAALGGTMSFAATVPSDVVGQPCEKAVQKLTEEGIITGDTDGLFHPQSNLTRAQVSIMLAKAISSDTANSSTTSFNGFSDLSGYGWAASSIELMTDNKIAKGYPDGTFKPGENVTVGELSTFVVRACGYNDTDLTGTWPANYINQAEKLGLYENLSGDVTAMKSEKATKEQAAIIINNGLDRIKEEAKKAQQDQEKEQIGEYTYGKIEFDSDMTAINGTKLASDVKIYTYGDESDYSKDMKLPKTSEMSVGNLYSYKNVSTVGFYKVANGKVTEMIIPEDCGFTGKVYGVINSIAQVSVSDENVSALNSLAAGHEVSWACKKGVSLEKTDLQSAIARGDLFEIATRDGRVKSVTSDISKMEGKYHKELGSDGSWKAISEKDSAKKLLKLNNDVYIEYKDSTMVYLLNDDGDEYEVSTVSAIKKGYSVRIYDVSDDDNDVADIIIAKKADK